ncbi:hypothetical protein C0J52_09984 [Blattella germanica]|nr:hypothetical protein C0J52_09984 [Blattella germanica]
MSQRKLVSLEKRLEAIRRLDRGEAARDIAIKLGVSKLKLISWQQNRIKIEEWCKKIGASLQRKTLQGWRRKLPTTGEALALWYAEQRRKGIMVTTSRLHEKALYFQRELQDLTTGSGWLERRKEQRLERGESVRSIAVNLGITEEMIQKFVQDRTVREERFKITSQRRKYSDRCRGPTMGESLALWYAKERRKGVVVTDSMVYEKALCFQKQLHGSTSSCGWLERWKEQRGFEREDNASLLSSCCERTDHQMSSAVKTVAMETEAKETESQRGNTNLVFENHKYYKGKDLLRWETMWRSCIRKCRAKVYTRSEDKTVLRRIASHNHDANVEKLNRQIIFAASKKIVVNFSDKCTANLT